MSRADNVTRMHASRVAHLSASLVPTSDILWQRLQTLSQHPNTHACTSALGDIADMRERVIALKRALECREALAGGDL